MAEEPESSFEAFAQAYRGAQGLGKGEQLESETGTALVFADICASRARLSRIGAVSPSELDCAQAEEWEAEQHTWELIHLLFSDRFNPCGDRRPAEHIYETPLATVQRILESDSELAELRIVRDWLQNFLPVIHNVEVRKGYLSFTKNTLRSAGRSNLSQAGRRHNDRVLKQLDPDSAIRGPGKLDLDDANYEKALLRTLFEYIRAGELETAVNLSTQTSQPWRAASLRGALFYHNPQLSDIGDTDALGNQYRSVWRQVAEKAANSVSFDLLIQLVLDPYERAIYGALCGHLPSVLAVSETWEEQLWCHINARFEERLQRQLQLASPANGLAAAQAGNEPGESLDEVFEHLTQSKSPDIEHAAMDPYHITQRAVITNQLPDLIARVNTRLAEMQNLEPETYARLVRFFAHLVLYCHLVEIRLPIDLREPILNAYVSVLQKAGQSSEMIALYSSSLDNADAHVVYADYLRTFSPETSLEERRRALLQAQPHGLDPAIVARCTVDMTFTAILPALAEKGPISDWDASLSEDERRLICSVDWLTFFEATYADALLHCNRLMRMFMVTGRLHAAHNLLRGLPSELFLHLDQIDVPADQVLELDHWRNYFDVLDKTVVVRGLWADYCQSHSSTEQHDRFTTLKGAIDAARSSNMEILELGWLRFGEEFGADMEYERLDELAIIRRRYIPEIILSLHMMLVDTSQAIPENLSHALRLPNMIADERLRLYSEFAAAEPTSDGSHNLLRGYLEQVRTAALLALDRHQDPLGCDKGVIV